MALSGRRRAFGVVPVCGSRQFVALATRQLVSRRVFSYESGTPTELPAQRLSRVLVVDAGPVFDGDGCTDARACGLSDVARRYVEEQLADVSRELVTTKMDEDPVRDEGLTADEFSSYCDFFTLM
jgi:hypothetical protein